MEFMNVEINMETIKSAQDHIHNVNIDNGFELRLKNVSHSTTNSHIAVSTHFECKIEHIFCSLNIENNQYLVPRTNVDLRFFKRSMNSYSCNDVSLSSSSS